MDRELVVMLLGATLCIVGLLRIGSSLQDRADQLDFAHYYASSRILAEGGEPYRASLDSAYVTLRMEPELPGSWTYGVTNPPPLIYLLVPVSKLSLRTAYWMWQGISLAALLLMVAIAGRIAGLQSSVIIAFAGVVLIADATFYLFYFGQVQALVGFLLIAGFRWLEQGRNALALLAVTGAGLLKLFPFVLLPWFAWKARRHRWAFLPAAATLGIALFHPWQLWLDWYTYALPVVREQAVNQTLNFSAPSLVLNAFLLTRGTVPGIAGLAVSAAFVGAAYFLVREREPAVAFAILLSAGMVASLTAWMHYFILTAIPLALLLAQVIRAPSTGRVISLTLVGVLVLAVPSPPVHGISARLLLAYLPLFGLITMALWLWVEGRRLPPEAWRSTVHAA